MSDELRDCFGIIGSVVLGVSIFLFLLWLAGITITPVWSDWKFFNRASECSRVRVKFADWLSWYYIAPTQWNTSAKSLCRLDTYQYITFSLLDYVRYRHWLSDRETQAKKQKSNQDMERLLLAVQRDINKAKIKSSLEMDEAKQMIKDHIQQL